MEKIIIGDFVIEDGVLVSYKGNEGQVCVPDGVTRLKEGVFQFRDSIVSVTLPEGLLEVGKYCFAGCFSLTEIAFPETVVSIEEYALFDCRSLKKAELPSSLKLLGKSVFGRCSSLESLCIPGGVEEIPEQLCDGCALLNSVVINEGTRIIKSKAFSDCRSLSKVCLPKTLSAIRSMAFLGCENLLCCIPFGVLDVGAAAFSGCSGVSVSDKNPIYTSDAQVLYASHGTVLVEYFGRERCFEIPKTVTAVGKGAFFGSRIESVIFHDSVNYIGEQAFNLCRELKEVTVPGSVKSISNAAFCGCTSLEKVVISEGTERIEDWAFSRCVKLKTVSLPETLTHICYASFCGCGIVPELDLPGSVVFVGKQAIDTFGVVRVPKNFKWKPDRAFKNGPVPRVIEVSLERISEFRGRALYAALLGAIYAYRRDALPTEEYELLKKTFAERQGELMDELKNDHILFGFALKHRCLNKNTVEHLLEETESVELRAILLEYKGGLPVE